MSQPDSITSLVISPHVDDEVLGCGGILGTNCFVYYCGVDESEWNEKHKIVDPGHRISRDERLKELEAVSKFLGFKYGYNCDSKVNMYTDHEFLPIFEQLINSIKPEKIYLPHPGFNQDHRAIFNAAFTALRPHDKNFFVKKVLVYEAAHDVLWDHRGMKLNYFVPIDIDRKLQAYAIHESQVRSYRSPDMLRRIAKLRGDMSDCEFAEAFQILRWVDSGSPHKRETSQLTSELNTRIMTNTKFGDRDLDQWLIEELNPEEGETILDVGCGTGNHILKLAKLTKLDYSCVGFDASDSSINNAIKKEQDADVKVRFFVGDMDNLNDEQLKDNSFDTIVSIYSIYYSKSVTKVLETLKEKVKPHGRVAIMGPYKDNNKGWFDLLTKFMKLPENIERVSSRFMEEEVVPFARANFNRVKTLEFVNNISIPSYEDLHNYWVSNVYYKEGFNPGFEKYAKEHFEKNRTFDFFKKALLVVMRQKKSLRIISLPKSH